MKFKRVNQFSIGVNSKTSFSVQLDVVLLVFCCSQTLRDKKYNLFFVKSENLVIRIAL